MYVYRKSWRPDRSVIVRLLFLCLMIIAMQGYAGTEPSPEVKTRAEQKLPFKRSEDGVAGLTLRVVGGLIITVLIGIGVAYGIKRFLPAVYRPVSTENDSHIQLLEIRRLTPKTTLFLVEVSDMRLLLAQNGDGITILHRFRVTNNSSVDAKNV